MAALLPALASVWWLGILPLPVLLVGFHRRDRLTPGQRRAWVAVVALFLVLSAGLIGYKVLRNVLHSPEFDFYFYWIFGQAAVQGLDPYDSAQLARVAEPLAPSASFRDELLYLHWPQSLLLFYPLGWMNLHAAAAAWQTLHLAVLGLTVYLLWRGFFPQRETWSLLLTALLALTLRATFETVQYTQVNFLLLALALVYWRGGDRRSAGAALALGTAVKPILAAYGLTAWLYRQWKTLLAGAVVSLALCAVAALLFGPDVFSRYLAANPVAIKAPTYFYFEPINQSLLATLLRLTGDQLETHGPFHNRLFWTIAAVLFLVSTIVIASCRKTRPRGAIRWRWPWACSCFPRRFRITRSCCCRRCSRFGTPAPACPVVSAQPSP